MTHHHTNSVMTVGWREWVSLPELGLPWIKAKMDTGHQGSLLHVFFIEPFMQENQAMVRFGIHPLQHSSEVARICESPVLDTQPGHSTKGHVEQHYIIETLIAIGNRQWRIPVTLSQRDDLNFRLHLGHSALDGHLLIDPSLSFTLGKPSESELFAGYHF